MLAACPRAEGESERVEAEGVAEEGVQRVVPGSCGHLMSDTPARAPRTTRMSPHVPTRGKILRQNNSIRRAPSTSAGTPVLV